MRISVVFSFRNEEAVLGELIRRTQQVLRGLNCDYELLFVNDASTDGSLAVLEDWRTREPAIKILNMSRRFGIHPCVQAGLRHASGDAVIYLDADLQDPPELIPQLVERWRAGADVVNTIRTRRHGESPFKMWLTRQAYRILHWVSETEVPMNMGEYKLLSRRVVDELAQLNEQDPFFRGLIRWVGFRQDTVYYERDARFGGETHFPLLGSGPIREFMRGLLSFSAAPLYVALILGFAVSGFSLLYAGYVVVKRFLNLNLPGWSAIMVAVLFLGGMILLTNGLIGLYIARIHNQLKNRPLYIIRDKIGF